MQLRDQYAALRAAGIQVVAIGPDRPQALRAHFEKERLPFEAIADPSQQVLKALGQQYRWYTVGLLPAMLAIAPSGAVVWQHYAKSPQDLPSLTEAAAALGRRLDHQGQDA